MIIAAMSSRDIVWSIAQPATLSRKRGKNGVVGELVSRPPILPLPLLRTLHQRGVNVKLAETSADDYTQCVDLYQVCKLGKGNCKGDFGCFQRIR
jgi:hypothetical protein